ncbi:MAG TPA: pyridoxal-phosphate dependent enzyme [Streptosporangiaceae bacterium]|nr:pyridoxal-phosphate dependent enzyme [Streptosporangiaceae bacterium]
MNYVESVIDLVGGTPLVRLGRVCAGVRPLVLAKLEYLNPGGSVKDRIALAMVRAAEQSGDLVPGGTIIEPTSGNTGVALAMIAALRGYRCVFTCPDKVSPERINLLRAYGAEVVICPATAPADHRDFYRNVARRLAAERPDACLLDQYANPANPRAHYLSTGPEIWEQTSGRITHLVASLGTGGTLSGAGRYLKQVSGGTVTVIGADPDGSAYTCATVRPYLLEGVGQPFPPKAYDPGVADELIAVTDKDALAMTRRLARDEAILTGGSGGMAVAAALTVAARHGDDAVIVVMIPDSGRGYVSKIFNDDWMARRGFAVSPAQAPCGDPHWSREVPWLRPDDTIRTALAVLREHRLPAAPVTTARPPVRLAEVLGRVSERRLTQVLAGAEANEADPVRGHLEPPPAFAGIGQSPADASAVIGGGDIALILDGGIVRGMVTRSELICAFTT